MKKIYSIISLFIITFMLVGVVNVKAETTYKKYNVGEEIVAQVDKEGHKGTFIVIAPSSVKDDYIYVIQKNKGLDDVLKAIAPTDPTTNTKLTTLAVDNAMVRTALTYGLGNIDSFLDMAPAKFNGYIRTEDSSMPAGSPFGALYGVMTSDLYEELQLIYKDDFTKIFAKQSYWLDGNNKSLAAPTFNDGDIVSISGNKFTVKDSDNTELFSDTYNEFDRIVNGTAYINKTAADYALTNTSVKYEPALMFTICKKSITTTNTPNPNTADMNVIMLSIIGILSLGIIGLTTKKLISIK